MTAYYPVSYNFDKADTRFQVAIPKYIGLFGHESLIYLAKQIEDNDQCYARSRAREDHIVNKSRIDDLFDDDLDYDGVPSFRRKVVTAE